MPGVKSNLNLGGNKGKMVDLLNSSAHLQTIIIKVRNVRRKMLEIITKEVSSDDLKGVVNKLIPDSIASDIMKACQGIYPLHDVYIRKVKVMKRPRFDLTKLMDMHGEGSGKSVVTTDPATGEAVDRPEGYEPPVMEAV